MLWAQEGSSKSVESVHDSNLKSGIQTKVQKGDFKPFSHVQIFDYSVFEELLKIFHIIFFQNYQKMSLIKLVFLVSWFSYKNILIVRFF